MLPVFLDRLDADVQIGGDLLVPLPLGDQLDHFQFPGRERGDKFFLRPGLAGGILPLDALGDGRAEETVPRMHLPDRPGEDLRRGLLDEVAGHAHGESPADVGVVAVRREDDYFCLGQRGQNLLGGAQPVEQRHRDIHHHHGRAELLGQRHRLAAIVRLAHDHDHGIELQQAAKALAHDLVVIGQQNSNWFHGDQT